jgi:hypothetical protein
VAPRCSTGFVTDDSEGALDAEVHGRRGTYGDDAG